MDNNNDIAIIGIGHRLPGCKEFTNNELWNNLLNKFDGIVSTSERWSDNFKEMEQVSSHYAGLLPLNEIKSFDPLFFGINPSEVPTIDPQQRLLLKCVWEALEDSMIDPIKLRGSNTSVFIGCSTIDYQNINKDQNQVYSNTFGSTMHSIANRLSYCFDFRGTSITIDTACSSSLNSIKLGCGTIQNGTSSVSIAGGVNLIVDFGYTSSVSDLGILSKTKCCKTFDASADGFSRAEGAGVVVLKSLNDAIKDGNNIYCVIKGSSSNVDSSGLSDKSNFYSPSSQSQSNNIKMALQSTKGSVQPSDIKYFEAHGTGTPTGDPIETKGISMALNTSSSSSPPLLIGSIKSNIGHLEAASGVASLIKCCLMFKNKCFAPNIHFNNPNPKIKFDEWNLKVVTNPIPFDESSNKPVCIGISNFGVTGSNCCLILSQFIKPNNNPISPETKQPQPQQHQQYLIPFSANSTKSLQQYKSLISTNGNFYEFVENQIKFKSTSLYQRSVIIANDWNEFNKNKLNSITTSNSKSSNITIKQNNPITVFVFCGQGSQYNSMGLELYNNNSIFKQSMDLLDEKLSKYYGYSILNKLRSTNDNYGINNPTLAQPAICMIQISLFELYKHWGIEPSFIVGHSLGELSSSYCSGMIDLDTFCYLVYHRSIAQESTNGLGKMLSINISADEYLSNYSKSFPSIEIACFNSPTSIVVAGNEADLIAISSILERNGIFSAMLGSHSSFHTSSQNRVKDYIMNLNFNSKQPKIPTFSTVTTNLFGNCQTNYDNQYIFDNIIKPVKFNETISNIYKYIESIKNGSTSSEIVFVEVSPHPTLTFYLKQMVPTNSKLKVSIYSPLHKKKNDVQEIQTMISQLYCQNGYNINFKCQLTSSSSISSNNNNNVDLPNYQWDDNLYWKEDSFIEKQKLNGPPIDHLGFTTELSSGPFNKSYQTFIDIKKKPYQYLKGHVVKGKYYFAGCGYIDNLLKMYPSQDLIINELQFKSPLIFIEGVNQCLQTNVYQIGNNQFKLHFHYKDNNKSNEWVQSAIGNFQISNFNTKGCEDDDQFKYKLNINKLIKDQCNLTKLSKNELYSFIKSKTGLSYTGVFQSVNQCFVGDNCSLSEISVENCLIPTSTSTSTSFINTPLLDNCLHGILVLLNDQCKIVFDRIEDFKFYSSNIPINQPPPSKLYVYSIVNSRVGDSYFASIKAMLLDGTIIFEIENAVCTSLTPIKDSLKITYPIKNEFYSLYQQPKDSPIQKPSSIYLNDSIDKETISYYEKFISNQFYLNINNRNSNININLIKTMQINELVKQYCLNEKYQRLFKFVFETIKQNLEFINNGGDVTNFKEDKHSTILDEILLKSSNIISKLLFPLDGEDLTIDSPQSLFENGLLDKFYNQSKFILNSNEIIAEIIEKSIKPLIKEKMVFRILEFGGGTCSLSTMVLDKIKQLLLENQDYQIDIEYTWSDVSPSFIANSKDKLSNIKGLNIIYSILDLDQPLLDNQSLKPSYYDYVIMSNVLHVVKDVKFSLYEIFKVLTPNGQLLFVEPPYKSILVDSIFGVFDQWWIFEDTNLRTDRCCMKKETWLNVLSDCNFKNIEISNNSNNSCMIIQSQKPSILSNNLNCKISMNNDKVIIFGTSNNSNESFINCIKDLHHHNNCSNILQISNILEFNQLVETLTDESIIYFIKTIDTLSVSNFKEITFEFIQINQKLLELNIKCKHVLITNESRTINYLSSSVIGSARYFDEFPELQLFSLDFDMISLNNNQLIPIIIKSLTDSTLHIQREFLIRNNEIYYERYKSETDLNKSFKSDSFEKNSENLMFKLDSNLEYKLNEKQFKLNSNQVEIKVLANSISYKDYLIYSGSISDGIKNPQFGNDFSGIITNIGSENDKFKIGDQVYGISSNGSSSSSIITDLETIHHIPSNISYIEASSIPSVYLVSYYSLFKIANFDIDGNEIILIHSASNSIGLSTLNLLKWKFNNKSKLPIIFVTVSNEEKKQYLLDTFGDFITEIFLINHHQSKSLLVNEIKTKLKSLDQHSNNQGVDLIINTLSSDYLDLNFKLLSKNGKIIDLSNNSNSSSNDIINLNQIKNNNFSFHKVNILNIKKSIISKLLKIISNAIECGELKIIPIIEYSNSSIKDAILDINQRQHIGKMVINHDTDILGELINNLNSSSELNYSILKSNYEIKNQYLGSNILITGQSGIALEILKWIIKFNKSVENIIILSKSTMKWEMELLINKTMKSSNNKIKFHYKSVDVSDEIAVEQTIDQILNNNPSIKNIDSIIHFAFIQITRKVNEIDMESLNVSHGAKTIGAINLHNQSIKRGWKLINFILSSSVTSILGSVDQCSYVSANTVLDSLSNYRKSIGLPCICTNYGAMGDTGFVSRNESVAAMFDGIGINPISTNLILGCLDLQIQNEKQSTNLLLNRFNFIDFIKTNTQIHLASKFDYQINLILNEKSIINNSTSSNNDNKDGNDDDETRIKELFLNKISELLSIQVSKINQDLRLLDYGSDSLLIVQIKNWIDKELGINTLVIQQLQNNTIYESMQLVLNSFYKLKKLKK